MKVLVAGGAGYIGSHMCKCLHDAGHEVVVLDNLATGHRAAVKWGPLIEASVADGAKEIDIVIERGMVLRGDWQALYDQVKAFRKACGDAHIKTILGTGELATQTNIAKASLVCMLAGADFIKTSTGKEKVNANLVTSLTMIRMIRWFAEETGIEIGYKPAGGIATAGDALKYMALMKEELGTHWLQPHLFRFGASSLLTDIERQLEHGLTGHYAADYRQPMV